MSYKCINLKDENNSVISEKISYSKCPIKKNGNMRMFFSIFTLMIIFLIGLILPKSAKAYSEGKYQNYFYVKVMNNTLSIFKSSKTEELYTSRESDIKLEALSLLGVDILNPISIIVKEVPFLKKNETSTDLNGSSKDIDNSTNIGENIKTFILNPFKLGEKQVSKTENNVEASDVVAELYNPALKKTLNNAKPEVLIYHSHTCEAYRASDMGTSNVNSSIDETINVTSVGDVIEEELEKNYGIAVIHDKTVHDKGDYENAYKKSGVTLDKYLKQYGDFKLIIDLHRDSVDKSLVTTKLNGKNVAKFMFVVTKKNPRYAKQKILIDSMIGISNKLYPNLLRSTEVHSYEYGIGFYSQNRSDNAVMFEVGSNNNTIDEAKETGKYLARIIAEQLNGKSE